MEKSKVFYLMKFLLIFLFLKTTQSADPIIDHVRPEDTGHIATIIEQDHIEINPRFGNNSEEALYITLWETQCLSNLIEDIESDSEGKGDDLEKPEDVKEKGGLFERLERWALYQMDFFGKTDIRPFMESIQKKESMKFIDHNLTPFVGGVIALLVFLIINMILFCVFTFVKKLAKIKYRQRNCCVKFCIGLTLVILLISIGLLITSFVWTGGMFKIEEKLLCEATRVPHALFFGNPEIYLDVKNASHFIGLERTRSYMEEFLNESNSYTMGTNLKLLQEIESENLKNSVAELENTLNEFFVKYEGMKGRDSSGNNRVPLSISYSIPFYKSHMMTLLDRYKLAAEHLNNISEFSKVMQDSIQSKAFIRNLKESHQDLADLQKHISTFWNDIMTTSFDSTLGFKISVIGLVILVTLIVISQCANLGVFLKGVKIGKIKNKINLRCLMILVLFISFWGIMAMFEVGRGIFSSIYGCSVMYQMENEPFLTKDIITPYILEEEHVKKVFDHCYFNPLRDTAENSFSLLSTAENKITTANFFSFLDGIKMIHEDTKAMNKDMDIYYTDRLIDSLYAFKSGESLDFDDVFNNLSLLNYNFDCSNIYYSLTDKDCSPLPAGKTSCVKILTGHFTTHECMSDKTSESAILFDNLKEYITREQTFIDNIVNDVRGDEDSIQSKIYASVNKFEKVDEKVRKLNTNLNKDFDKLVNGRLSDWLDCGVIRNEVKKTFNSLCNHDTQKMMKFGDLNFFIIFFSMITVNILFILTCCFKELPKKKLKSKEEDLDNTFEEQNVFDDNDADSMDYYKKDDSPKNIEMKPFGDFGTFKNPEPKKIESSGKGDRVDVGEGEFNKIEEKDEFDDPFNQFGDNEYDFKK